MTPEKYQRFTQQLISQLSNEPHVLGLVALGSMAALDYKPDQWSDHDFFVIVESGHQEHFRTNFHWLPEANEIIFSFRETAHGVKILYTNAHLLEFAIFDLNELNLARINRYRILIDRCELETHMQKVVTFTKEQSARVNPDWLFGQFLTNLLVGVGRYHRGEHLSASFFVKGSAFRNLTLLFHTFAESPYAQLLDDLDPFRRMEIALPEIGKKLNQFLQLDTPDAASEMLELAKESFQSRLPNYPIGAVAVVSKFLNE